MHSSIRDFGLLTFGLMLLGGVCLVALALVPHYEALYAPFRNDLDRPMRWLFVSYRWWGCTLLPAAALWLTAPSPRKGSLRTAVYCSVAALVLGTFGWWALQPRPLCCTL
ncbi:MAG: hypothetical protein KDJ14_15930 [Xanthomonadales bacterium]|nr:hypothetical protein [Xanthomonadales bacterium]